jgi:hypothetical protein
VPGYFLLIRASSSLPTRLPDKEKKLKWVKPRKSHGKASARPFTGAEAAANQAEQSNKVAGTPREDTSGGDDGEIMVPATPPRPAGQLRVAGESQGGTTITLSLRTPDRPRPGPDLAPRVSSAPGTEPEWQLPASTAPPSLGQVEAGLKRKRKGTIRYKEGREDGHTASVGLSQPRM